MANTSLMYIYTVYNSLSKSLGLTFTVHFFILLFINNVQTQYKYHVHKLQLQ